MDLNTLLETTVVGLGYELVDVEMSPRGRTIRVFIDRRMHCVGCPIAPFHTVVEAAAEHGQDLTDLAADLEARAAQGEGRPPA